VGKGHNEKMRPLLDAGDDRIRLAKIRLGMTRTMCQRHKHLPQTTAPFANVILYDRLLAREAMLVAKTLENPLRRVALLAVNRSVCQSALNIDPLSASNIDPLVGTMEVVPVVHRGDPRGFV